MKYTNYKCTLCKEPFKEDDDVVVCAECGIPYHRECYLKNGKCVNDNKHGTDEQIKPELCITDDETENCVNVTETPLTETQTESNNATQQIVDEICREIDNKDYSIDEKPVSYFEAAVGKNQKFYIPRFLFIDKTKKSISWNTAAFFVPLSWSIYRKMYKISALIFALYAFIFGSIYYSIFSNTEITNAVKVCEEEDENFAQDILLYFSNAENVSLTKNQKALCELAENYKLPTVITVLKYIVFYGMRMIMGIYATNMYYKKLKKYIEKTDKLDISPDMKRSVLYRKCGTLPIIIAILIGIFEWQMF